MCSGYLRILDRDRCLQMIDETTQKQIATDQCQGQRRQIKANLELARLMVVRLPPPQHQRPNKRKGQQATAEHLE